MTAPLMPCAPGERFEPVGYRAARCLDCGQVAPMQNRNGVITMLSHPRPAFGTEGIAAPMPAGHAHPDCGTPRGHNRHARERTAYCEPCKAAKRGYEQGLSAANSAALRAARTAVPRELAEAVVKVCRAIVYRRPAPQLRQLAITVVRIADAELCDDESRAA